MTTKETLRHTLQEHLREVIHNYLQVEVGHNLDSLRFNSAGLNLAEEARTISEAMTENIFTTLDVYGRQLLYPNQHTRTGEWLRTQNYMHRREDDNNRPQDL